MTQMVGERVSVAGLLAAAVMATAGVASAASPTIVWQTTAGGSGVFSADGSSILLTTPAGFEMRRATDGALQNTIALPTASRSFDARAFSPDKQYVAISIQQGAAFNLEVWRVSTGTLVRTITTNAVRSMKTLDISSGGLLAAYERFAYGGGGYLRVFRISDGSFVTMLGPYTHNSTTRVRFSPNGQYMAAHDWFGGNGVRVLRTSDWGTAFLVGDFADVFRWELDSASVWTSALAILSVPWKQVNVPAGTVKRSVAIDDEAFFPSSVTSDGRFILGFTTAKDAIKFLRTSDGGAQVTYPVTSGFSYDISPTGTVFTGGSCASSPCTFYVAKVPPL